MWRRPVLQMAVITTIAMLTMVAGQATAHADDVIENGFEPAGSWPVTWSEGVPGGTADHCANGQGNPDGTFTYVYPTNLGAQGVSHPVIVWGNGTNLLGNENLCPYEPFLRHLASWGYVVVAANSDETGDGNLLRWGGVATANSNADPSSPFYQKLDTSSIGVAGHSQGALGAINAGLSAGGFFSSVTPISLPSRAWQDLWDDPVPSKADMDGLGAPIFFIWGTEDWLAIWPTALQGGSSTPEPQRTVADWAPPTGPFAAGAIVGADHSNPIAGGTAAVGYAVAWGEYTLACHGPTVPAFVAMGGAPAEIATHTGWRHVELQGMTAAC